MPSLQVRPIGQSDRRAQDPDRITRIDRSVSIGIGSAPLLGARTLEQTDGDLQSNDGVGRLDHAIGIRIALQTRQTVANRDGTVDGLVLHTGGRVIVPLEQHDSLALGRSRQAQFRRGEVDRIVTDDEAGDEEFTAHDGEGELTEQAERNAIGPDLRRERRRSALVDVANEVGELFLARSTPADYLRRARPCPGLGLRLGASESM